MSEFCWLRNITPKSFIWVYTLISLFCPHTESLIEHYFTEADKLRGEVVEIAAIAVGSGADMDEINAIANDPDEYFTFVAEFTDLYNLSTQVIHTICKSMYQ